MSKDDLNDWDETASNNTDVGGVNIAEGTGMANMNDAMREMMAQIRAGFKTSIFQIRDSTDQTKLIAIDASNITTGTTRTITMPDSDVDLSGLSAGSTTAAGVLELATTEEFWTGSDTSRALGVKETRDAGGVVTLTDATTIAVDMATFINGTVTLGGNRTLGQPSNTTVGQSGFIRIVQDGTGSRTLAYHADWKFAAGVDPTLSTGAADIDVLFYTVTAANEITATLVKDIG